MPAKTIDTGVIFSPRGGSAQVIRYLLPEVARLGDTVRLFAGSLGQPGAFSHSPTFYGDLLTRVADYTPAAQAFARSEDPMACDVPMHPSYEDSGEVPDRLFAAVSPRLTDHLVNFWWALFAESGLSKSDVVHLHHLTPQFEAARRLRPDRPIVVTLHGTELKMMHLIDRRLTLCGKLDVTLEELAAADEQQLSALRGVAGLDDGERLLLAAGRWQVWRYGEHWLRRMRTWAHQADRVVVISGHDRELSAQLLGMTEVAEVPNGVDTDRFRPLNLTPEAKLGHLRDWLVREPRGWAPGAGPGSIGYTEADLDRLLLPSGALRPIIIWVGRFLDFKRVPVLLHAFANAVHELDPPPALLMWGGYPGEWEGEHPADIARAEGIADDVYFVGWRDHAELALGLNIADLMVAPAVNESFGLVYLESMAAGTPVVASATGGPLAFVRPEGPDANGWLVRADDVDDTADKIVQAFRDDAERFWRAASGVEFVRRNYSWAAVAQAYGEIYDSVVEGRKR